MTLLSLASLGSCAAVFIAGAGAGRSLWLLFTCGVLVSAFLCLSVVRALVHKAAPYELLTLIVPQWLFLTFLTVIMKFKTSWQARLLSLTKLPGFLLLLLLLHLPPIVATLLCLPTELVAQPAAAALGIQVATLVSIGTYVALGCGTVTLITALLGLNPSAKAALSVEDEKALLESGETASSLEEDAAPKVKVSFKTFAVGWIALSMVPPLVCYEPFSHVGKFTSFAGTKIKTILEWVPPDAVLPPNP